MSKFQTLSKDLASTTIYIQGARKDDTLNAASGVVFQNYDDDTKQTYDMATIGAVDHFGGSNLNGRGDLTFCTNSNGVGGRNVCSERVRLLYDGRLGVGTSNPSEKLELQGGDLCIWGAGRALVFKNDDGTVAGSITNNAGTLNFGQTATMTGSELLFPLPIHKKEVDCDVWVPVGSWVHSRDLHGNLMYVEATSYYHTVANTSNTYQMRVMSQKDNTVLAALSNLSNLDPVAYQIAVPSVRSAALTGLSPIELQVRHVSIGNYKVSAVVQVTHASVKALKVSSLAV